MNSLAVRAVVALVLMIGFYVLALAIAAGLLAVPVAMVVWAERIYVKLAIGCIVLALAILWSILPRIDRFEAPGPRLIRGRDRLLFDEIARVAAATGLAMPSEVYLVNEVNAWVAQRGGIMGFFSRRVMGIGLPLLQLVTVSELRAILAHEFGHYHGGDTKLGPWIYKTRGAIGRTIGTLDDSWLQKPFLLYGKLFLRITQAISRNQELLADRLSAAVAGTAAAISSLTAVHRAGPAHDAFWSDEVAPLLEAGFRPRLVEGFTRYVTAPAIATQLDAFLAAQNEEAHADPYDSHPPLPERLAALRALPATAVEIDDAPALCLLPRHAVLEQEILGMIAAANQIVLPKESVGWDETAGRVYVPMWKARAREHAAFLSSLTPAGIATVSRNASSFAAPFTGPEYSEEARAQVAAHVVGCALVSALVDRGWTCDASPGAVISLRREGKRVEPFGVLPGLASGTIPTAEWEAFCREEGIAEVRLGATIMA